MTQDMRQLKEKRNHCKSFTTESHENDKGKEHKINRDSLLLSAKPLKVILSNIGNKPRNKVLSGKRKCWLN